MRRFLHRLRGWPGVKGRQSWAAALVLAFPLLSLVTGFGIGLSGFLFLATALAWRRECWRLLREGLPHTRWVLLAFLLQLADIAWLAVSRGHGISDIDGPLRTCLAVAAMLVVQAASPPARWLWLGAAGGAAAALAFDTWQRLALGVERPGGLMNPITFGDLSLCLALLSLAGAVDAGKGAEAGRWLRSSGQRWMAAAGAACGLAASLLTGSRGGWLALLPPALLLTPLACRIGLLPRRRLLAMALLAGALAAAAYAIPRTGVRERVEFTISETRLYLAGDPTPTSLSVRLELWKAGAMLVRERPWAGRDTLVYKQRMREWIAQGKLSPAVFAPPEPPHMHNDVLQVLVTRGVTGLLAWGGMLAAPACFFWRRLRLRQRGAAALAGRELVGTVVEVIREPDALEQRLDRARLGAAGGDQQRQRDVLADRDRGEGWSFGKQDADVVAAQGGRLAVLEAGELAAGERDRARGRAVEAGEHVQEGALAAAGLADDRRQLAGGGGEGDAAQRVRRVRPVTDAQGDVVRGDGGVGGGGDHSVDLGEHWCAGRTFPARGCPRRTGAPRVPGCAGAVSRTPPHRFAAGAGARPPSVVSAPTAPRLVPAPPHPAGVDVPVRRQPTSIRPRISRMISSVPPPIGPRRASRTARSRSPASSGPSSASTASAASNDARCVSSFAIVTSRTASSPSRKRRRAW